jgi:hypothetical protein
MKELLNLILKVVVFKTEICRICFVRDFRIFEGAYKKAQLLNILKCSKSKVWIVRGNDKKCAFTTIKQT